MEDHASVFAGDVDTALGRHHLVGVAPADVGLGDRGDVDLGALPGRLPFVVGARVVQGVRADARPVALDVARDVHEARPTGMIVKPVKPASAHAVS
jgi:hypothetical protein